MTVHSDHIPTTQILSRKRTRALTRNTSTSHKLQTLAGAFGVAWTRPFGTPRFRWSPVKGNGALLGIDLAHRML